MKHPGEEERDGFGDESPPPRWEVPRAFRPLLPLGRTILDWWRDLFILSLACLAWGLLSLTVVGGPPAGAALYVMCRATILHEQPDVALFLAALRSYFIRSWLLGLVGVLGVAAWLVDLIFYTSLVAQGGLLAQFGALVIFYAGIIWLQTLFYAWSLMVCRPDLNTLQLLRNGVITTLRKPGTTFVDTSYIALLLAIAWALPPLLVLLIPVHVALLGLHSLYLLAPELVPEDAEALNIVG
jgi:uncharacterized membrane protein YesL